MYDLWGIGIGSDPYKLHRMVKVTGKNSEQLYMFTVHINGTFCYFIFVSVYHFLW